mmetsp:Transcript_30530/g.75899  ORF Transcript_30530/g.75899 Transcript_30530/m.75899 type:complete len:407 (-) Transcript_30530:1111-2331(-)
MMLHEEWMSHHGQLALLYFFCLPRRPALPAVPLILVVLVVFIILIRIRPPPLAAASAFAAASVLVLLVVVVVIVAGHGLEVVRAVDGEHPAAHVHSLGVEVHRHVVIRRGVGSNLVIVALLHGAVVIRTAPRRPLRRVFLCPPAAAAVQRLLLLLLLSRNHLLRALCATHPHATQSFGSPARVHDRVAVIVLLLVLQHLLLVPGVPGVRPHHRIRNLRGSVPRLLLQQLPLVTLGAPGGDGSLDHLERLHSLPLLLGQRLRLGVQALGAQVQGASGVQVGESHGLAAVDDDGGEVVRVLFEEVAHVGLEHFELNGKPKAPVLLMHRLDPDLHLDVQVQVPRHRRPVVLRHADEPVRLAPDVHQRPVVQLRRHDLPLERIPDVHLVQPQSKRVADELPGVAVDRVQI